MRLRVRVRVRVRGRRGRAGLSLEEDVIHDDDTCRPRLEVG